MDDRIGDVEYQAESRAEEREEQNENGVQIEVRAKHEVRCLQIMFFRVIKTAGRPGLRFRRQTQVSGNQKARFLAE